MEQSLLIIFSFEVSVRLKRWGCYFFIHPSDIVWNWLDFIIVSGGVVDMWLMPAVAIVKGLMGMKTGSKGSVGQIMTMLRMMRLLRILRLVRLVKNIPPLFNLIIGIAQAMQGMVWVLVLTAVLLYVFALLAVKLIGHGMLFGGAENVPEAADGIFTGVPQSMFVLFKVMNGDTGMVEPLFDILPALKLIFVLFMVLSSWAILSILTAVVSENMLRVTEANEEERTTNEAKEEKERSMIKLKEMFALIDHDQSGEIDRDEFYSMLEDELLSEELCEAAKVPNEDLKEIFDDLARIPDPSTVTEKTKRDKAGNPLPVLNQEEFIKGLHAEGKSVSERSMFRLTRKVWEVERVIKLLHHEDLEKAEAEELRKMEEKRAQQAKNPVRRMSQLVGMKPSTKQEPRQLSPRGR